MGVDHSILVGRLLIKARPDAVVKAWLIDEELKHGEPNSSDGPSHSGLRRLQTIRNTAPVQAKWGRQDRDPAAGSSLPHNMHRQHNANLTELGKLQPVRGTPTLQLRLSGLHHTRFWSEKERS